MDVAFGGRYYQACYSNLGGEESLVTFCGDEPDANPSVVRYLPGSSCETCIYRIGGRVDITLEEATPMRHLMVGSLLMHQEFPECSRMNGARNPAGICPHYGRDERVIVQR